MIFPSTGAGWGCCRGGCIPLDGLSARQLSTEKTLLLISGCALTCCRRITRPKRAAMTCSLHTEEDAMNVNMTGELKAAQL